MCLKTLGVRYQNEFCINWQQKKAWDTIEANLPAFNTYQEDILARFVHETRYFWHIGELDFWEPWRFELYQLFIVIRQPSKELLAYKFISFKKCGFCYVGT